jgi:Family of unknown function (DUF6011)
MALANINQPETIESLSALLREQLAKTPAGPVVDRVRAAANAARQAHTLSVPLLHGLVLELVQAQNRVPAPTVDRAPDQATSQRRRPAPRPNKFRKPCGRCGKWVEVGEGVLERNDDDTRWMVNHPEDPGCPVDMLDGVPEGRYAIDWAAEGDAEDIKFYQILEGVLYAQASADLHPITKVEAMTAVLDVLKLDPRAASLLYGFKLGQCGVCGLTLTNQESRDLGIGPVCRKNMGW